MPGSLITSLCRANIAILSQKLALTDVLLQRHGSKGAHAIFQSVCPIVGASIGQHFRHSMDHIEIAALVAAESSPPCPKEALKPIELHYDLRVRGGTLEKDMELSINRITSVIDVLHSLSNSCIEGTNEVSVAMVPVHAHFFLSSDQAFEEPLPSTVARELGFAAHHAIHHMAMVKIISLQSCGLHESDLPDHFGRAPSTIKYDGHSG
uniref:Uncharacterized protein n=1 Tax=Odontella aurita TaxID=265563 RepID=A0A7S4NEP6_9STRA|mmetsp:Transcript_59976/g.177843  ORF Transcript_59976/g.177843 Transcript_59976/m.177843 type:complete len:208 (+) Transcript_59976:171-794(+)